MANRRFMSAGHGVFKDVAPPYLANSFLANAEEPSSDSSDDGDEAKFKPALVAGLVAAVAVIAVAVGCVPQPPSCTHLLS